MISINCFSKHSIIGSTMLGKERPCATSCGPIGTWRQGRPRLGLIARARGSLRLWLPLFAISSLLDEELPLTQCAVGRHKTWTNLTSLSFLQRRRFALSIELWAPLRHYIQTVLIHGHYTMTNESMTVLLIDEFIIFSYQMLKLRGNGGEWDV